MYYHMFCNYQLPYQLPVTNYRFTLGDAQHGKSNVPVLYSMYATCEG